MEEKFAKQLSDLQKDYDKQMAEIEGSYPVKKAPAEQKLDEALAAKKSEWESQKTAKLAVI